MLTKMENAGIINIMQLGSADRKESLSNSPVAFISLGLTIGR